MYTESQDALFPDLRAQLLCTTYSYYHIHPEYSAYTHAGVYTHTSELVLV